MPPSPAMRCSIGREQRAENHKRGRSLESGIIFREKDDDLALFNEVQSKERDNFLLQSNDDLEDLFSTKLRQLSNYKLGVSIPARGESSDLLNAEGEKNDYDWLLTPPDTPLFPSLDDETPPINIVQRGRPRSQPISISRSSTMERSHRSSRGSASPNRLSPSPRSTYGTYQSRGRPSSAPHSSPPSNLRHATPTRRPSPPPNKSSTPAPRSSTPTPRRMSAGFSGPSVPSRVRGNSPVKTNRGNSSSPKIRAWQANIPGFSSEAPPNLRTSLADRPASYVRGSSPASRNGSKSVRQSMSPTASRSISSSHSHDRDQFSSHSKASVASSGDDDVDSIQSVPLSCSDRSAPRSVSTFSNTRGLSYSKKPTRIVTSSSVPKRSFDMAIRQMDQRKVPQNMFRPLLSSVPSSTFYAGKSGAVVSRNSSVTTSSNASSDLGTSGPHDTEGSEQNREDVTSACVKLTDYDMQEELFPFENADSSTAKSENNTPEQLPHSSLDENNGSPRLDSRLVGKETSIKDTTIIEISVASEVLDGKSDLSDLNSLENTVLCSKCGRRYPAIELIEGDPKLCAECRGTEVSAIVTPSPNTLIVDENSPGASATILDHVSVDAFAPSVATPELLEVTAVGESGTECCRKIAYEDQDSYSKNRKPLPERTLSQQLDGEVEPNLMNQRVEDQQTVSSSRGTAESGYWQPQNVGAYSNSRADASEGAGISLLLTSSSGKGPIIRNMTFSATSITCDDFSYARDSATSTRSSCGHGSASASSSVDFGSTKQAEAHVQCHISSRKYDIENYRHEMRSKHQRSVSSLSGTSAHAFQASSLATSFHEESLEVSAINADKDVMEATSVALQKPSLASGNREGDNFSSDIESDNNWRMVSEFSSCTTSIHQRDTSMASVSNFEEADLHDNGKNFTSSRSSNAIDVEASSVHPRACTGEEDATSNAIDRDDIAETPNHSSLNAISELEVENDPVVSPDSVFDISSQNSKSSIDDLLNSSPPATPCYDRAANVDESIKKDLSHSSFEESTAMLEGQGIVNARSLTLEEATDTILFCSSIVHNLAYEAANIAIEKENMAALDAFQPVVTIFGKSNPDSRDSPARLVGKRNSKSQKARQRRLETGTKPPSADTANVEESDVSTAHIVGAPNKGDSIKPPKLESKCNCAIM